jgi:hypothetical protein
MFGSAGLKVHGKTFAMLVEGRLVAKLPRHRVEELLTPTVADGCAVAVRHWPVMGTHELDRVRGIALALPEVHERLSHGEPCFFVRNTRALCYYHDHHNGDGRISLWCPAPPGLQEAFVSTEPERFFRPPVSAKGTFSGWLGVFLDTAGEDELDWDEIAAIIRDAFRYVAPKVLVTELDHG